MSSAAKVIPPPNKATKSLQNILPSDEINREGTKHKLGADISHGEHAIEEAIDSASDFSDYPAGSTVAIKSPTRDNVNKGHFGSPLQASPSSAYSSEAHHTYRKESALEEKPRRASNSTNGSVVVAEAYGTKPSHKPYLQRSPENFLANSVSGLDSPTLGSKITPLPRFGATKEKNSRSTGDVELPNGSSSNDKDVQRKALLPDYKLEKVLEKNPRLTGESVELRRLDSLPSVFEDTSDEETYEGGRVVRNNRRTKFRRPALIKTGSSTIVGLKEMLRLTGPVGSENNEGPSKAKLAKVLGDDVTMLKGIDAKRAGIVGLPATQSADRPIFSGKSIKSDSSHVGPEVWQNPQIAPVDGLRSHPLQRAATVPARRKVAFTPPANVKINPEHKSIRQSIVSTPYPTADKDNKKHPNGSGVEDVSGAVLSLVIYSHSNRLPIVKRLVIPRNRSIKLEDPTENGKPKITAPLKIDSDDEKLFNLIHKEYTTSRGFLRTAFSARSVYDFRLLSLDDLSESVAGDRLLLRGASPYFKQQEDIPDPSLLRLYQSPRLGRRQYHWVKWIARLSGNREDDTPQVQNLAMQLIEGWSYWKIVSAVITVLLSSLAATLLWTFLGTGGNSAFLAYYPDAGAPPELMKAHYGGFRGSGTRVEAGVVLGGFVLILGWTAVGAWMLLSWLL